MKGSCAVGFLAMAGKTRNQTTENAAGIYRQTSGEETDEQNGTQPPHEKWRDEDRTNRVLDEAAVCLHATGNSNGGSQEPNE